MARQKEPYMCRAPGEFKVRRGFTPQAAYTEAYKPLMGSVWICTDEHTLYYAVGESGMRHYFVLIDLPKETHHVPKG